MMRTLPMFSAASLGIGIWIGSRWEKNKCKVKESESKISLPFSPVPCVSAATHVHSNVPAIVESGNTKALSTGSRVSEIMRYGFPGLDNLRSYKDYVLSYDRRNRNAHWVFEHLTQESVKRNEEVDRISCEFKEDEGIHAYFRATNSDYKKSGYDRGHLAAAGNHRLSQEVMDQTFSLSNISPQVGKGFNRDAWNQLEKFVRGLTKKHPNVYVCTGPLYLPRKDSDGKMYVKYEVIGQNNIAVPTHFFKVVVCESQNGSLDMLSFVMPNQVIDMTDGKVDLKKYLVPVQTVERAAGFLLFDRIPKNNFRSVNGIKIQ